MDLNITLLFALFLPSIRLHSGFRMKIFHGFSSVSSGLHAKPLL